MAWPDVEKRPRLVASNLCNLLTLYPKRVIFGAFSSGTDVREGCRPLVLACHIFANSLAAACLRLCKFVGRQMILQDSLV
jgi:hypothetical protein